jgi:hypothetical protein
MVKGETIMAIPGGEITTSEILVPQESVVEQTLEEAIVAADAEEAVEEYAPDEVAE